MIDTGSMAGSLMAEARNGEAHCCMSETVSDMTAISVGGGVAGGGSLGGGDLGSSGGLG